MEIALLCSALISLGINSYGSVDCLMLDGRKIHGEIAAAAIPGDVRIKIDKGEEKAAAGDIDRITIVHPVRSPSGAWVVQMLDKTRLRGQIVGGDPTTLMLRNAVLGDIQMDLDFIATITRADQPDASPAGPQSRKAKADEINLLSGDLVSASVSQVSADGVKTDDGQHERNFAWDKIRSITMDNDPPKFQPSVRLRLGDDGILMGTKLEWTNGHITLETIYGATVEIRVPALAEIEPVGARRIWMSEMPLYKAFDTPYFEKTWPMRPDANAVGGQLQLDGDTYSRGLGLHSAGRWTWWLGGNYERLRGLVGIDDSAGPLADADFTVSLDGKQLFEWKGMKHKAAPKKIDLDITGGQELTIEVGFGKNGNVEDRVDFVDASLLKLR